MLFGRDYLSKVSEVSGFMFQASGKDGLILFLFSAKIVEQ